MSARDDKNTVELPSMKRDGQPANQSGSWLAAMLAETPNRVDTEVSRFAGSRSYAWTLPQTEERALSKVGT